MKTSPTIFIEKNENQPVREELYWLREEGAEHPYAYVKRVGGQWWAAIPGGYGEYHKTRKEAIAAVV